MQAFWGKFVRNVNQKLAHLGALPTKKGDILVRLDKKLDEKAFSDVLKKTVIGMGIVAERPKRKKVLELRDLDSLIGESEVTEALDRVLEGPNEDRKVFLLEPNRSNQCTAIITIEEEEAVKLEQMRRICIGFASCRVRRRVQVTRCYKCLGYGHCSGDCTVANYNGEKVQCFFCEDNRDHVAGTGACGLFRDVLKKKKEE